MQEVREKLTKHFENFRFDKTHHLKFGDIKLTIWEQEEIVNMLDLELEKKQKHLNFLKGFSEAWNKAIEEDSKGLWILGANTLYRSYLKIHNLPELSADELIIELNKP